MRPFGIFLVILGVLGILFALSMDTSVPSPLGRVNNIGLMNDKQNYLMIGAVTLLAGLLLSLFGSSAGTDAGPQATRSSETSKVRDCPQCAESIRAEANKCRFCGSEVDPVAVKCSFCSYVIPKPAMPCSAASQADAAKFARETKSPICRAALKEQGYNTEV